MHIVLITRENSERVTHVSVYLWSNYTDAINFCYFVNNLSVASENRLVARIISASTEHSLKKREPFKFDDLVKVDNRTIQRLLRELDSVILAIALTDAKKGIKDVFFRNMSKRAGLMLKEDMEYLGPENESDIENARKLILNIYNGLPPREYSLSKIWAGNKNLKENKRKDQVDSFNRNQIVLVFHGTGTAADCVSVFLFDVYNNADNFCDYLNNLKPDEGSFFYARHADQMIEYETTKPLLVSFDQIFELNRLYGEPTETRIIRETLKKYKPDIILVALKGMDKRSRMLIIQSLPVKTRDEINERIEQSDKDSTDHFSLSDSRKAQQRIINTINKTVDKFKRSGYFEPIIKG